MATVVALSLTTGAVAKEVFDVIKAQIRTDFVIEIDGKEREFKNVDGERVYPILHDGTTYLPVRAIGEIMGKTVYWYEDEKRISLKDEKSTVTDADVIVPSDESKKPKEDKVKDDKVKDDKVKDDKVKDNKPDASSDIGKEKVKEIVLDKAGLKKDDVDFVKVELDYDDGIWKYEVEFRHNHKEYDAEVKADDGKILKLETEFDD